MAANADSEVKVIVVDSDGNESEFSEWKNYAIESDIFTPADAFSFTASNMEGEMAGVINKGDLVKVLVDGNPEMVGHIDDVAYQTEPKDATVEYTGRDLFGFLVDCSAQPQSLKEQTLKTLAEKLTADWIIEWRVNNDVTLPRIKKMKIEPGENVLEVLQRFASKADMLVWLEPDGTGVIGKPDYTQTPLYNFYLFVDKSNAKLNNVESSTVTQTWRDQFSSITVCGQSANSRSIWGKGGRSKFKAISAIENELRVNRPLVMTDGDCASIKQAKQRANLEMARRRFESESLEYTVKGHYQLDAFGVKQYFHADRLANVVDEPAGIEDIYYITRRRFYGDESGQRTDLSLRQKGIYLA